MLLRGRSKDRSRKLTPPGPVSMSNDEFANYLADLRNNRVARPNGARPLPSGGRRETERAPSTTPTVPQVNETSDAPIAEFPRSASALSHKRRQSSISNYSSLTSRTDGRQLVQPPTTENIAPLKPSDVVPSATYIERGLRWMEKEEAVSLREAMEDMDIKKQEEEEARIHAAAQNEASELVYQHQNPEAIKPDAPYRYNEHLRKNSYAHARTASVGRYGGIGMATGLARDITPRSVSDSSSGSGEIMSPRSRVSSGSSEGYQYESITPDVSVRHSLDSSRDFSAGSTNKKPYGSITGRFRSSSRRRSSAKRNISGETGNTFTGEQIWEEPEEGTPRGRSQEDSEIPAPLRIKPRNPLNRVQFAQEAELRSSSTPAGPAKSLHKTEIYRNPPTQSRNPLYTANSVPKAEAPEAKSTQNDPTPETNLKDGLEIRGDDIRQATSMRLKDRSPKLPTPTAVSDKLGRPIVSFDVNWKPAEADKKSEVRRRSPFDRRAAQRQSVPTRSNSEDVATTIPTIHAPNPSPLEIKNPPTTTKPSIKLPPSAPSNSTTIATYSRSPIPTINAPDSNPPIPTINLPNTQPSIPTINLPDSKPSVPAINFPDTPTVSVSAPDIPEINVQSDTSTSNGQRPLPDPKTAAGRPKPHGHSIASTARKHWSPVPVGKRATATCHQCTLPIEGRVVALHGKPQHFHPECFICFTCGTGLESLEIRFEPETRRAQRIDRIKRRAQGEEVPEIEGQTMAEDGDERLRFYCHLDWHDTFAPKCKHCKTAIIGEHTIALGEHWHYGHFFCAECGDPFEAGQTHIEKDGYAWCLSCQTKRTERRAPKCKKCKKPVIGQYVQALGGEWHDDCFRCHECRDGFDDGRFYPKQVGDETHVLCIRCLEMKLKA